MCGVLCLSYSRPFCALLVYFCFSVFPPAYPTHKSAFVLYPLSSLRSRSFKKLHTSPFFSFCTFFFFFFETYLYPSFINQANSIIRPLNSIIISAFSFSFPISVYSLLSFPLKQLFASKLALRNITHTPNNNAQLAFMISVPTKCQL